MNKLVLTIIFIKLHLTANNGHYKSHHLHPNVDRNRKGGYQLRSCMQNTALTSKAKASSPVLLNINSTSIPSDHLNITPVTKIAHIKKQSGTTEATAPTLQTLDATLIPLDILNITPVSTIQKSSSLQFETLRLPSASLDKLRSLLKQVQSRLFDMNTSATLYQSASLDKLRSLLKQVQSRLFDMNTFLYSKQSSITTPFI